MSECPKEETFIALLLEEGPFEAQLHVKSCAGCSRKYKELTQNMKLIETALSAPPPPPAIDLKLLPWIGALAPVFAAAAAVFIAGFYLGQRYLPFHTQVVSASAADSLSAQNGPLTAVQRGKEQPVGEGESATTSYVAFLQDNFEQDDACLSQDHPFNPACARSWLAENR